MKTKVLFIFMATCAMTMGLISCKPTNKPQDPEKTNEVLINLAELGDSFMGKTPEDIDSILAEKGFTQFYGEHYEENESDGHFEEGEYYYSNGIQLDSSYLGQNITDKISLQKENACILEIAYYAYNGNSYTMLSACYILPKEPQKDYKTLSTNLYNFYYKNYYPFLPHNNYPEEFGQAFSWLADILIDSTYLDYTNEADLYKLALESGWMTQEEYDKEIANPWWDGDRNAFVKQLDMPYHEAFEEIEAVHNPKGYSYATLCISDEYSALFEVDNIMVADGFWAGYEWEPVPPQYSHQHSLQHSLLDCPYDTPKALIQERMKAKRLLHRFPIR